MNYAQYRIALIKAFYGFQLKEFLKGFQRDQPTIILLPGGMGSQLDRTGKAFPREPNTFADTVWADRDILWSTGDALTLEIDSQERDIGAFVVAANGEFHFATETPYKDFLKFLRGKGWNAVVFGYDWRRPLEESAELLRFFVSEFQSGVSALSRKDPLLSTTFVCHSMGGLVLTTALRQGDFSKLPFHAIVTIATPFYGTSTHHERYYIGQEPLNSWYTRTEITRIIGSMPGPPALLFLPKEVFDKHHAELGLAAYPLTDSKSGLDADPFDKSTAKRWPSYVNAGGLQVGRAALMTVAEPIPSSVLKRFFTVRSQLDKKTAVALRWDNVDGANFDPERRVNPVHRVLGPGDGTVPYWSAFHTSSVNRMDLARASDHGILLEHKEVMELVASIVTSGKPVSTPRTSTKAGMRAPRKASDRRLRAVMKSAAAAANASKPLPAAFFEKTVQRALFSKLIW